MELQDEVPTMVRLGLTPCQARIYLTLARSGTSNAKTISKKSNVARPDVYRIMATLEKLGLIEKIISLPCKFKAISLEDAFAILMERKTKETSELQTIMKEMLKKFKRTSAGYNNTKTALEENESQFILMTEQAGEQMRLESLKTLERSSNLLTTWKSFLRFILSSHGQTFCTSLPRSVEFRTIIGTPIGRKNQKLLLDTIKQLKKYPLFKIRQLPSTPMVIMMANDQKTAWIFCGTQVGRKEGNDLYTNNPYLLSILHDYFENLWQTATEIALH